MAWDSLIFIHIKKYHSFKFSSSQMLTVKIVPGGNNWAYIFQPKNVDAR